jgi:hypothetical protein
MARRCGRSCLHALLVAGLLLTAIAAASPARSAETQAEIDFLLALVAGSDCVFIRNGDEHDGEEAAAHMRRKYEHFDDEIVTTDDFIDKAATRSLISRRAYEVRLPDGTQMETARWLREELAAFRARRDGPTEARER